MNRTIYYQMVFFMFLINLILSFFGSWRFDLLGALWGCYLLACFVMERHANHKQHVTTFTGRFVYSNSPYRQRKQSYFIDFFFYWVFWTALWGTTLFMSDKPSLYYILKNQ